MFSRHLNRFFLAVIKAKKPKDPTQLSISNIKKCRALLGMPTCEKSQVLEKAVQYMKERSSVKLQKHDTDLIYKRWATLRPLQCQINVLASSKEMGSIQSKYIYSIMTSWGNFLLQDQSKSKSLSYETRQSYKKMLIDYMQILTTTCYLLDLDEDMILLYLRVHFLSQSIKIQDKNHSQLRIILDALLKLKTLSLDSVNFLLVFTTRYPIPNIYHQKEHEIMNLIYSSIPNLSRQNKYHSKLTVNLLNNLIKQVEISKELKLLAINIYKNFSNNQLRSRAFHFLIEIFVIDKNNIKQKANLRSIQDFIRESPSQIFKFLTLTLLRADIWIEEFWIPYFQYVSTGDNYKEIKDLTHFMVDDLLVEMKVGGNMLEKEAKKFREFLNTKGIEIQKYDLRKEQERVYGRIKQSRHTCQMHVANSMRLICGAQILTEVPIKYFMVDVLVDKSIIVEINNTGHYKVIDGVSHLNLKSQFRERILKQSGYKCHTIRVDDLSSSNYNMMEQVYKIVESSGNMRRIVNGAPSTEKI